MNIPLHFAPCFARCTWRRRENRKMSNLTIRKPGLDEAEQLAKMLCEDEVLRADLGMSKDHRPTADDFLKKLADWCPPRRATTYAILAGDRAVGTISISYRDPASQSAQIGYWVGSRYRRRGYASRAFAAILAQAASEGIASVSATVATGNTPSRRLWEHYGSTATATDAGKLRYRLDLNANTRVVSTP